MRIWGPLPSPSTAAAGGGSIGIYRNRGCVLALGVSGWSAACTDPPPPPAAAPPPQMERRFRRCVVAGACVETNGVELSVCIEVAGAVLSLGLFGWSVAFALLAFCRAGVCVETDAAGGKGGVPAGSCHEVATFCRCTNCARGSRTVWRDLGLRLGLWPKTAVWHILRPKRPVRTLDEPRGDSLFQEWRRHRRRVLARENAGRVPGFGRGQNARINQLFLIIRPAETVFLTVQQCRECPPLARLPFLIYMALRRRVDQGCPGAERDGSSHDWMHASNSVAWAHGSLTFGRVASDLRWGAASVAFAWNHGTCPETQLPREKRSVHIFASSFLNFFDIR